MGAIRAIPKEYSGVLFRSTLEADWAYNLDRMGMRWQYEPEGVVLSNGQFYRPDIYLPLLGTFVEVKGPHDERIDKPHQLAADTMHAPGCEDGTPSSVHPDGPGECACGFGASCPWRMVIIARPATNGRMCVEGAGHPEHPDPRIAIAQCGLCSAYSFADLTGRWWCRRCHRSDSDVEVYDIPKLAFPVIDHGAGSGRRRKRKR